MKRLLAVLMMVAMMATAFPVFGKDADGRICRIYYHVQGIGDKVGGVRVPSAVDYPEYADGTKDKVLIENRLYAYYYLETGVDEITGIAYFSADGTLGPVIPLAQTEWRQYAGYIPFSVKKNAFADSNVTGRLDDTTYIVERDAAGNIISKTPVTPGQPADAPAAWATEAITALKAWGKLDEAFFKNYQAKITRKDFAALSVALYEALKGQAAPAPTAAQAQAFSDTQDETVLKAHGLGLVSGYGNGLYGPADPITREQIARLLVGACDKGGYALNRSGLSSLMFKDHGAISDWALADVRTAYLNDIMKGTGTLQISPRDNTTREQALQLLYNTLKKAGKI